MMLDNIKEEVFEELQNHKEDVELQASQIDYFVNHNDTYYHNICEQNKLKKDIAVDGYKGLDTAGLRKQLEILQKQQLDILKTLGLDKQDLYPKYDCKLCNDTGVVAGGYCSCFKKKYCERFMQKIGVNLQDAPSLNNYNLDVYQDNKQDMQKVLKVSREYVKNFDKLKIKNLLFYGGTGLGKTYLAKSITRELLDMGYSAVLVPAFTLNQAFQEEHFLNKFSSSNSLEHFFDVDLLVIDDFGAQSIVKNVSVEYMLHLLDDRLSKNKSTIITTNLSLAGIENSFGARIASRLMNTRDYLPVEFCGQDLRKK